MAATRAGLFWAASYSPLGTRIPRTTAHLQPKAASVSAGQSVAATTVQSSSTTTTTSTGSNNGRLEKSSSGATQEVKKYDSVAKSEAESSFTLKDYYEQSIDMMRSNDGGPPRWFSPLESGARSDDSPLLLFLPGW